MFDVISVLLGALVSTLKTRQQLFFENLALRHQVQVLNRKTKRPDLRAPDRLLWVVLSRLSAAWKSALVIVQPETVIQWHRTAFRTFWRWKSLPRVGRPRISRDLVKLIRRMWQDNPIWGAIRIRDELAKLGIQVCESTLRKYRPKTRRSNQTWKTFLRNHTKDLVAVDFFTVPTATFRVLFVVVIIAHERRRVLHFNITDSPSAAWTGQQLVEAFAWGDPPRYLLRNRDSIYGADFVHRIEGLGLEQKLIAPRSRWQNPVVERLIGSIRRECLDHVIVLNEHHLRQIMSDYIDYYHRHRTHRSLNSDSPETRSIEAPDRGNIVALSLVGGLHHRYSRQAA